MNGLACGFNRRREEEMNPKTLHLSKLVQLIEPQLLYYYLEQVSLFLKNSKKDLWFPLIPVNLDAFLVRMIQDPQNLRGLLNVLDEKCRELAADIVEMLEKSKGYFTVVHSYVNSNSNKSILVYRKVVETKTSDSSVTNQFERQCPLKRSTSPDETTIAENPPDIPRQDIIPAEFKTHWLDATLAFVNDSTANCLECPEMNIEQAEFIYALVKGKNSNCFETEFKSLYAPFKEALKVFNENYEFKVSFLYLSGKRVRLIIEKVMLNNNRVDVKIEPTRSPEIDNLSKTQKNVARKTHMIKQLEPNFIRTALYMILDFINEETEASIVFRNANEEQCLFLQSALAMAKAKKMYNVFDEESRVALRKIAKFLSTCQNFDLKVDVAKLERNHKLRSVSIIKTPKATMRAQKFASSTEKLVEESSSPPTPRSTSEDSKRNSRPDPRCQNNPQATDDEKVAARLNIEKQIKKDIQKVPITNKTKETQSNKVQNERTIDKSETGTGIWICLQSENRTVITENKTRDKDKITIDTSKPVEIAQSKVIDKKSTDLPKTISNVTPIDKKTTEQVRTVRTPSTIEKKAKRSQSEGRGLGLRKARLLEGLSTPLESDVAMRMMRQMGWEGGPLGVRGDGLMEPVMPALHLKSGAGLGHVPPPKKEPKPKPAPSQKAQPQKQPTQPPKIKPQDPEPETSAPTRHPLMSKTIHCHKPPNIRLDILRHIFSLITEEPLERIVVYSTKLSKKELKFVHGTVQVIVKRGKLTFNDDVIQDVFERIIEEMVSEPDLQLVCLIGSDKKLVHLSKNNIPQKLKTVERQPPVETVSSIASKYLVAKIITTDIITALGKQLMPSHSNKSAKSLGHRIITLSAILKLLQSDDTEYEIKFDYPLTCKQVTYLKEVLSGINHRTKWSYSTAFENHIAMETLATVEDKMYVTAVFANNNQQIIFRKIFYRSRFENSSLERRLSTIEIINNNNNDIDAKEVTKFDENDKNKSKTNVNVKENAKNDVKTANDDLIVISDSDLTDVSIKKELIDDSVKFEDRDEMNSLNNSFESEFEQDVKDVEEAILKVDREEKMKKLDETLSFFSKDIDDFIKKDEDEAGCSKAVTSKRFRSDSVESHNNEKKTKTNILKYLGIASDSYPLEEVGLDDIVMLQNRICDKLDETQEKAELECLGIKNGAIIYCCYNEFGRFLIESVAKEMNLKTINITNLYKNRKSYKVTARINSYIDINLKKLFGLIEAYNAELKTDLWSVIDVQPNKGYMIILMEIDGESFEYISENNFSIFAGFDKLRFNVSWD